MQDTMFGGGAFLDADRVCAHINMTPIMEDLKPFKDKLQNCIAEGLCKEGDYAITKAMLNRASELPRLYKISVRNGTFTQRDSFYAEQISDFVHLMPDMDVYVNILDEPRILANEVRTETKALYNVDENSCISLKDEKSIVPILEDVCTQEGLEKIKYHSFATNPSSFSASEELLPVFSQATVKGCFHDIIIPSAAYSTAPEVEAWEGNVLEWNNKHKMSFWRGSTTGGHYQEGTDFHRFHRNRFIELVNKDGTYLRKHVDAKFTKYIQCDESICEGMQQAYGEPAARVNPLDMLNYKYLIDIDGNSFSQRYLTFLRFSQSLIFKIASFDDYITRYTEPFKHYIPIKMNFSDFEDKLRWAHENDQAAEKIATEAYNYARSHLKTFDMKCYTYKLLMEYSKLLEPVE